MSQATYAIDENDSRLELIYDIPTTGLEVGALIAKTIALDEKVGEQLRTSDWLHYTDRRVVYACDCMMNRTGCVVQGSFSRIRACWHADLADSAACAPEGMHEDPRGRPSVRFLVFTRAQLAMLMSLLPGGRSCGEQTRLHFFCCFHFRVCAAFDRVDSTML